MNFVLLCCNVCVMNMKGRTVEEKSVLIDKCDIICEIRVIIGIIFSGVIGMYPLTLAKVYS